MLRGSLRKTKKKDLFTLLLIMYCTLENSAMDLDPALAWVRTPSGNTAWQPVLKNVCIYFLADKVDNKAIWS
jgi:hypothetical protein